MTLPYETYVPTRGQTPIIISAPHVGTELPLEVKEILNPELALQLPDTDWFVDKLYDFSRDIGAVLIRARYSRYVIDLNRPVEGPSLYTDARRQTEFVPSTSFSGIPLYPEGYIISEAEKKKRIELYYKPYYQELHAQIERALKQFGHVLLWDGHSIVRHVPSIQAAPFPDLMLGDRDGHTADPRLVAIALDSLRDSSYTVAYNSPFKGGQITRHHGEFKKGVHAMQLEMSQDIYMTDGMLDPAKANVLKPLLQKTLLALAEGMKQL